MYYNNMIKMTPVGKVVIGAVIAVLLLVLIIASRSNPGGSTPSSSSTPNGGTAVNAAPGASSGQTRTGAPSPTRSTGPKQARRPVITIVAPATGDAWKINTQNTITWDQEGGISGNIYLVDARTQKFVGVVIPQTGPHQTYYTWNTRDLFLDRTSPLKKDVVPGIYIVKLAFDGNNIPVVTGPVFTITN
jgi:hypothetical protein